MHDTILKVTETIKSRSHHSRQAYLNRCEEMRSQGPLRKHLSCSNLVHGYAASPQNDKLRLRQFDSANIAIISAYNDMLSAHQPLEAYPAIIKQVIRKLGGTAQFAGGVPAMCDGVTQGRAGMELSLFSRDVIATATAIALSHDMFDAALCLGVCDKIVPGLLIGALSFGHLPFIFMPAGPMPSGISNKEKAEIRQAYAQGKVDSGTLLKAEEGAYHSSGTCTFFGTANSNQMLLEAMGLHIPGSAFVNPGTPLREALTRAGAERITRITALGDDYSPISKVVDERTIVNAIVALLATGGSTNHAIHWIAVAKAAGIHVTWDDFSELSSVTPLLARIYPNGTADVNHFHSAGGIAFVFHELINAGLMHGDVTTIMGEGLALYAKELKLENGILAWSPTPAENRDDSILRSVNNPFSPEGGLRLLAGNLGRAIIKVSAVAPKNRIVEAPAVVFHNQDSFAQAFKEGALQKDFVAVLRFQGPQANGMPELHKLTPYLGALQDQGFQVALVTDGRMSGASGKIPAAIHLIPEAINGGAIAIIRDGDIVRLDAEAGRLEILVPAAEWRSRKPVQADLSTHQTGLGRELFGFMRNAVSDAEHGATVFGLTE